jgi:hypothetical protein
MLKNIDDRLRAGIFNPQADLNDLENYLKYTIGRSAQDTVAKLDKQASNDSQLESWCLRRAQLQKELAIAREVRDKAFMQLEAEKNKPDPDQAKYGTPLTVFSNNECHRRSRKRTCELQDKITERAAKYRSATQDMENFAFSIIFQSTAVGPSPPTNQELIEADAQQSDHSTLQPHP